MAYNVLILEYSLKPFFKPFFYVTIMHPVFEKNVFLVPSLEGSIAITWICAKKKTFTISDKMVEDYFLYVYILWTADARVFQSVLIMFMRHS